jgi:hypothetical protein
MDVRPATDTDWAGIWPIWQRVVAAGDTYTWSPDTVEAGYRSMQFNAAVSTNIRAIGLWRSLGFDIVGTVPGAFRHPVHGPVDLHIMYREL